MTRTEALMKVAQAWRQPTTSSIEMDARLAEAFADILMGEAARGDYLERDRDAERAACTANIAHLMEADAIVGGLRAHVAILESNSRCDLATLAKERGERIGAEARVAVLEAALRRIVDHPDSPHHPSRNPPPGCLCRWCGARFALALSGAPCSATGPVSPPDPVVPQEARPVEHAPELRCPRCWGAGEVGPFSGEVFNECPACKGSGGLP